MRPPITVNIQGRQRETSEQILRPIDVLSRLLIAFLALAPVMVFAQVGRSFTAVETFVALSDSVRVGRITKLEQIQYDKPLRGSQTYGKPYRVMFAVEETIRGKEAKQVEVVLALQITSFLDYMSRHGSLVLMTGGSKSVDSEPTPEIGIEEDGKPVEGKSYEFRFLDPLTKKELEQEPALVKQIGITFNDGKMFTADLQVVRGHEAILKRARAFAARHPDAGGSVWLRVPNRFGELVGYSNAYCGITLPVCPETEHTLVSLLKNPDLVLGRIPPQPDWEKNNLIIETLNCLKPFPSKANAKLVRTFVGNYNPGAVGSIEPTRSIQQAAWDVLEAWKMLGPDKG